jgi:hypothetical protein
MPAGDPSDTAAPVPPPVENPLPPDPIFTESLEQLVARGTLPPLSLGEVTDIEEVEILPDVALYEPPPSVKFEPDEPIVFPGVELRLTKGWVVAAIGEGPQVAWRADQIVGLSTLEDDYGWVVGVVLPTGEMQVAGRWREQVEADSALIHLLVLLGGNRDGTVSQP